MKFNVSDKSQQCPYCHQPATVNQTVRFALPDRELFTERYALVHRCADCSQIYMSVYECSPVNFESEEIWNLYQYYLPTDLQKDMFIGSAMCTTPKIKSCRCSVHNLINEMDFSKLERMEDE